MRLDRIRVRAKKLGFKADRESELPAMKKLDATGH